VPRPGRRRLLVAAALGAVAVLALLSAVDAAVLVHRIPTVPLRATGTDEGTTWLLVGSDSRERLAPADRQRYADRSQAGGERADLVLLLHQDRDDGTTLYSVPRDLYVGQQRDRPHRLGLALERGPQGLVDSLCDDLGIGVDHVLVADMGALVALVDATGPVLVSTHRPTRDRRAGLEPLSAGTHRLDGAQALAWVRSRSAEVLVGGRWQPDPSVDRTRTAHATDVLRQVRARLDDPVSVQRAAWSVGPRLRRDDGLGPLALTRLSAALRDALRGGRVVTVPARLSGTQVPFAFATQDTFTTLRPVTSASCAGRRDS